MTRALILLLLIVAVEGGVRFWRHHELKPSTAPVFFWKDADLVTEAAPPFGQALKLYEADRGMESFRSLDGGGRLQTMYMEWDDLEAGPFSALAGHESEVCNISAGFTILESRVPRAMVAPNGTDLLFHYAHLADPNGRIVHAYKMPWIQGIGVWQIDSSRDRSLRLKRSFVRHRGAARVIQFGVSGVASEEEAWEIVQRELQDHLDWRD